MSRVPKIWILGGHAELDDHDAATALDEIVDALDGSPLKAEEREPVTINDRALLIYTSGTTGLPKAASISHRRILNWGGWFAGLTGATPEDRLYDCLPLFHSVGGIVAPCSMLSAGGSVVISEKFSAEPFLARHRALGLHAVPVYRRALPLSAEGAAVRIRERTPACGWSAATACAVTSGKPFSRASPFRESSNSTRRLKAIFRCINVEGKPGAIGRIPPLLAHRFPAAIVRARSRARRARSQRGRPLHRLRARRDGRSHRPDRNGRRGRWPLRGLHRRGADRKENSARRVCQGRCLVPHRRSDAARRARASSTSSTGSATLSAGRARTSRLRR